MALLKTQAPAPATEIVPMPRPGGAVAAIVPQNWSEIAAMAGAICRAGMAPKGYVQNGIPQPDKVAVAIMQGLEVGLTPMAALQSIAVINGMPSLYGDGLMAVVRASGQLEDLQEGLDVDPKTGAPMLAWCKVKRRGEATWKERSLTWAECQRAGWAGKDGPWKQVPGRMMTIRVRTWLLRDVFADVLRGLRSVEEVEEMVDVTEHGSATTAPPAPKRSDYAEAPPAVEAQAQPEPPQQEEPPSEEMPDVALGEPEPEPITFPECKTAKAFFAFSEPWLEDPARTPAEAHQWEEFYRAQMKTLAKVENKLVQEALASVIGLYSGVIAKEQA